MTGGKAGGAHSPPARRLPRFAATAGVSRLVAALACAFAPAGLALAQTPVFVGGESSLDACTGFGFVAGLDARGENFLSLRAGPDVRQREIARLSPKQAVHICDESANGQWLGVVAVPRNREGAACGVSSPVAQRMRYRGPCRSGWIAKRYVLIVAD